MAAALSPVAEWFARRFVAPTPAQIAAWPIIRAGRNALIVSPTGTGKTFAAFFQVLDQLAIEHREGRLEPTLLCLYLSPLRALTYDLEKNLAAPLREIYGETPPIRVGLRSGDTEINERKRQFERPPHVLLTTPESLAVLLSQPKWVAHLRRVRWVIVDEIHALAENKRGSHLALSLERLDALKLGSIFQAPSARLAHQHPAPAPPTGLQRIGLSATVYPLAEVAQFLVGTHGQCEIVDVSAAKKIDLRLYTPLQANPYPLAGFSGVRMVRALGKLVQKFRTTLVFTNTRSGAEAATYWLKEHLPQLAEQIECHHASLDRDVRLEVEDRLKRGELRCVVCSTSLELGLDIGSIELVVMLATPKGVSKALQRTGRAGHNLNEVSRGLLMATNVNDLVECAATARLARRGHLDGVRIPQAPLDVLAQHLMSLGCLGEVPCTEAFEWVRRAWPYRDLSRREFDDVLDYLAGGGKSLRQQYTDVFGKIVLDEERGVFEARAGAARRDFLQNIGTIPNEGVMRVCLRNSQLGTVEEAFVRGLRTGDVFTLGGRPVRLERVGLMEAFVTRADGATPTVPRWGANKMPLSNRIGQEIAGFRAELRAKMEALPFHQTPTLVPWIAQRLEIEAPNAAIIFRIHAAQSQASEIPTADFLLVEELGAEPPEVTTAPAKNGSGGPARRSRSDATLQLPLGPVVKPRLASASPPAPQTWHYFFHALIGRAANDALSRVIALRLSRLRGGNAIATPDDYGFVLTVTGDQRLDEIDLPQLLMPEGFAEELVTSLTQSDLLKYHFRNAAQTGLMIYRNYFGEQKSVRKLQWSSEVIFNVLSQHEPEHVLLREARREVLHSFLDVGGAEAFLRTRQQRQLPVRLRRVEQVAPLSFGMYATKIKEALLVEDPRETLERLYHHWWQQLGGACTETAGETNPVRPSNPAALPP
jgi:ATP-dependent Lhr-like helicase